MPCLLLLLFILPVSQAFAANIYVDTTCSLSEAIDNANNNAATHSDCEAGSGSSDTIYIDANKYLSSTLPNITSRITIEGNNKGIYGQYSRRIFYVTSSGNLTINQLTLGEGRASSYLGSGGAIYNAGTLTVKNSTFNDNRTSNIVVGRVLGYGGAIYNDGTLTVENSKFDYNRGGDGGAIYNDGSADIKRSSFQKNYGDGAIYNDDATLEIENSTIANNYDIGIYQHNQSAGDITITNVTIKGNTGNGLRIDSL